MAAPRRTRAAPTWRIYYIILVLYLYIKGVFVLPYMGRVIPLETVGLFKPDGFSNILRVGLTQPYLFYAGDAVDRGASDRDRSAAIKWTNGPSDLIKHVRKSKSYNGWIVGDVAASHASIAWKQGAPEINQHVIKIRAL